MAKNTDKASRLQRKHWVTKHNDLNCLRPNDMTLRELRFFTIYLSKINPLDETTRIVRFTLDEFKRIMELKADVKASSIQNVADKLLRKIITLRLPNGGFTMFHLFKKFTVSINDETLDGFVGDTFIPQFGNKEDVVVNPPQSGDVVTTHFYDDGLFYKKETIYNSESSKWYVEMDVHDDALPLMFNLKKYYFKYQLWNALRLKSVNQLRMYEILKQYEKVGERILYVEELKIYLGIGQNEYADFKDFRVKVLNVCQQALSAYTDITFTYEPYGRKGRGGKIMQLKFNITKNKNHQDQLTLDKFIDKQKLLETDTNAPLNLNDIDTDEELDDLVASGAISKLEEWLIFFRGAFNDRFTVEEVATLFNIIKHNFPISFFSDAIKVYDHMKYWYDHCIAIESNGGIKKSFIGYLKTVIGKPIS